MMEVGEWKIEFSGNVNAFVSDVSCDADAAGPVLGGLACGSFGVSYDDNNVRTGLLPSWFGFHAERTEGSTKYGVTIGFQPGVDGANQSGITGGPIDGPLGLNASNFRQVFLEFSGENWGSIKIGRDLGLFGSDAILSDMTLLGVGTVSDLTRGGGNTSLGRIGVGYVYADWKAQLQYTTPKFGNGFQASIALVDPWGLTNLAGTSLSAADIAQEGSTYGWEAKLAYSWEGDFAGKIWASGIYQKIESPFSLPDDKANGFDVGAKVSAAGFEGVIYYYDGSGIGSTGFLVDGFDDSGTARDSNGGYVQVTYKIPGPNTKIGLSYGESKLDLGPGDVDAGDDFLFEKNKSYVIGIYHPVTSALHLVAEYTNTKAEAHNGTEATEKAIALGAILFY
jgi:predicted porin